MVYAENLYSIVNSKNLQKTREALRNGDVKGDFLPSVYVVETSSLCNLECIVCPNRKMSPHNQGYIDVDIFKKIILDISPYCEFLMLYWMGEPFLHSKLPELLSIARSHIRGKIVLSSNMTHLNEPLTRSILTNVDILLCCIDRWNKLAYEKIRRGSSFETVVSNTESILDQRRDGDRCEIVVKALDFANSSAEYRKFAAYWRSKGARPLLAWLNDWAGTFNQTRKAATIPIPHEEFKRVPCADLWFKLVMNWRGDIQMCCFDWNYSHQISRYNDKEDWLANAWQSAKLVELRQAHINGNWRFNSMCSECTTWGEEYELNAYVNFDDHSYFTLF
jgi:Iron-sulfur cluster-binding domain